MKYLIALLRFIIIIVVSIAYLILGLMGWVIYGGAIWFTKFVTRSWSTFYLWIINVKLTFVGLSTQDTFNFAANVGSKVVPIAIQYLDENDGWVDKDLFITFSSKWGNNKPK